MESDDWIPVGKSKKIVNKIAYDDENINGHKIVLKSKYVFWSHELSNKDWSINGYDKICTISTVSEFWKLYNNLPKLGYLKNSFFLMREGVEPIWEDPSNRNGGFCTLKVNVNNCLNLFEDLSVRLVCDKVLSNCDDNEINGISISPKNNWAIIKIWNKNSDADILNKLDQHIGTTYNYCNIKYIRNEPEY